MQLSELESNLRSAVAELDQLNDPAHVTDYFDLDMEDACDRLDEARANICALPNSFESVRLRALAVIADAHVSLECKPDEAARAGLLDLAQTYWPERVGLIRAASQRAADKVA